MVILNLLLVSTVIGQFAYCLRVIALRFCMFHRLLIPRIRSALLGAATQISSLGQLNLPQRIYPARGDGVVAITSYFVFSVLLFPAPTCSHVRAS